MSLGLSAAQRQRAIDTTRAWIDTLVIGLNLCPFARAAFEADGVRLQVCEREELADCLTELDEECWRLDQDKDIVTTILIYPGALLSSWPRYLDFVSLADELLVARSYEGIYQLASFHPDYQFAGAAAEDPANCTNRSPLPLLHILRESEVTRALDSVEHPENIPVRNQALCRRMGAEAIAALLSSASKSAR